MRMQSLQMKCVCMCVQRHLQALNGSLPASCGKTSSLKTFVREGTATFSELVKQEIHFDCVREVHSPRGEAAIGVKFNCDDHVIGQLVAVFEIGKFSVNNVRV